MYRKSAIAYIAAGSIFAIVLSFTSISSSASGSVIMQPLNMKNRMIAYADMADPKKYGGMKSGGGGHGMSLMDKNKDNKVSKEEFLKYNEAIFDKVDTNRDGSVDREEADNYVARSKPKTNPGSATSHGEIKKK
jgi:hypothetical protein